MFAAVLAGGQKRHKHQFGALDTISMKNKPVDFLYYNFKGCSQVFVEFGTCT